MRKKQSDLTVYRERRDTRLSGEPEGSARVHDFQPIFVIQKHDASHLHYDFRLAIGGVLVSWAIPKGPPRRLGVKRLAVQTEDHPLEYATFEGEIPAGNYGAGTVVIWDHGTYANVGTGSLQHQLNAGKLEFELHGTTLRGRYVLVRMKNKSSNWLLMKIKKSSAATPGDKLP